MALNLPNQFCNWEEYVPNVTRTSWIGIKYWPFILINIKLNLKKINRKIQYFFFFLFYMIKQRLRQHWWSCYNVSPSGWSRAPNKLRGIWNHPECDDASRQGHLTSRCQGQEWWHKNGRARTHETVRDWAYLVQTKRLRVQHIIQEKKPHTWIEF